MLHMLWVLIFFSSLPFSTVYIHKAAAWCSSGTNAIAMQRNGFGVNLTWSRQAHLTLNKDAVMKCIWTTRPGWMLYLLAENFQPSKLKCEKMWLNIEFQTERSLNFKIEPLDVFFLWSFKSAMKPALDFTSLKSKYTRSLELGALLKDLCTHFYPFSGDYMF